MTGTRVKIAYVDDDPRDLAHYSKLLGDIVDVVGARPQEDLGKLVGEIIEGRPDVVLIDVRLEVGTPVVSYAGDSLASATRRKYSDYPVVLLTNSEVLESEEYASTRDVAVAFDDLITKESIEADARRVGRHMEGLALGYRRLRDSDRESIDALFDAMGANEDEHQLLVEAGPPFRTPNGGTASSGARVRATWRVVETARWVRNVVLRYPGILYDKVHSATLLGVAADSFGQDALRRLLDPARYEGVFAPPGGRWWRRRILEIATRTMQEQDISKPILHGFRKAFERKTNVRLEPSVCNSCGHTPADTVCAVLREPAMLQCSLAYNPDDRPVIMDDARVSFKAIQQSNDFQLDLVTREAREIAERIMGEG